MCFTWHLLHPGLYMDFYKLLYFFNENFILDKNLPSNQPALANCTAHKTIFSKGIKKDFS